MIQKWEGGWDALTYKAPVPWPEDAPTVAPETPTNDGASILGASLSTDFAFEPLDWPGTMPEKLTLATGESIYYTEKMNWQIYTNWAEDSYDMSQYSMLHIDLFPASGTEIKITFEGLGVDDGGQGYKNSVVKTLNDGEWNSLDIALSEFPGLASGDAYDFSDIRYLILEGYDAWETALSVGNVYFYKDSTSKEIKYTTYENWQIKYGNEWTWSDNMTKIEDGLYKIEILWEGTGFNVQSDENPIKKDWYDTTDPDVTIADEVIAPVIVDVYLRVIDDETLKIGIGEAPTITHNIVEVSGTPATESTDGFEDAYKCVDCNQYFEDEEGTLLIGDEAAYNAWKLDEGKIDKLGHDIIKVDGAIATTENDGFKDVYKCNNCDQYFEDEEATKLIGDEAAYEAWKLNAGKIDKLEPTDPSENNKGKGGLVVLIIVIILVVLLGAYACGYFFLYRKGKLDNSGIKVIYSFLPKSKEEK